MEDTTEVSMPNRTQQFSRLFSSVVVFPAVVSITASLTTLPAADGFVPASIVVMRRNVGFSRHLSSPFVGRRTAEGLSLPMSLPTGPEPGGIDSGTDDRSGMEDNGNDIDDNIILHQQIRQADPEWYREYVSDLLGEDYCANRWPEVDLSPSGEKDAAEILRLDEKTSGASTFATTPPKNSERDLEESSPTAQQTTTEMGETEPKGKADNTDKEYSNPVTTVAEEEKTEDESLMSDEDTEEMIETAVTEDNEEEVDAGPIAKASESSSTRDAQERVGTPSAVDRPEEGDSPNAEKKREKKEETIQKADGEPGAAPRDDPRALVYRNITGKSMTCVPLAVLLELGYSVPDLERIQAEFLSIVVMDQRKCPSMGVPSLWKLKDPRAAAEITMVDSIEEATALVEQINSDERKERDSKGRRQRRQEARQRGSSDRGVDAYGGGNTIDEAGVRRSRRRETDPAIDRGGRGRQPDARRRPGRGAASGRRTGGNEEPPRRQRRSGFPEDGVSPTRRDRRRQQRNRDNDGKPRKIYRVPRDDTRQRRNDEPDPPNPNSPIWPDMNTFRDLLQKEADFRMNIIGDDWSDIIEEENDWRTGLYRSWLWSLNNGVGESIVPPSRYERARSRQNMRTPGNQPPPRPRSRPSQEPSSMGRRRRQGDAGQPPMGSRSPPRERGSQSRRQRRPRREPRDTQKANDDDNNNNNNNNNNNDDNNNNNSNAPISAAERRSKRRAERRRESPPDL